VATALGDWVLKGGFAMDLRLSDRARTTKDVELAWHAEEDTLADALLDAAAADLGDCFVVSLERTDAQPDLLGGAHRFHVTVSLAGRPFESFRLDVGTHDGPVFGCETLTTPDLLGFAGIPPVTVPALPLATQLAEKLHDYTRTYGGGRPITRTKDLIDLALVAALFPLEAHELRTAIDALFARRATHQPPDAVPAPAPTWRTAVSLQLSDSATTSTQAAQPPPQCSTLSYDTSSRPGRGIRATKSGTEASPRFVGRGRLGSEPSPGTSHAWQSEPTNSPRTLDRGLGGVMRRAGIPVQAMAKLADLSARVRERDLLNGCIEHDGIPGEMAMPRGRSLPWGGIR
jgi:hypothetical protein